MKKTIIYTLIIIFAGALVFALWFFYGKNHKNLQNRQAKSIADDTALSENPKQVSENAQEKTDDSISLKEQETQEIKPQETSETKSETKKETKAVAAEEKEESEAATGKIVSKLISWGYQSAANRKIDTIIVHSSYDAIGSDPYSVEGILKEYKDYGVSAHYLIDRKGTIYQLVEDKNIAYHAGVSKVPDGRTNVNSFSIGIEMINTEDGKFTDPQYSALNQLISSLGKKYSLKYILGHSEIAPARKTDPWNIEWSKIQK